MTRAEAASLCRRLLGCRRSRASPGAVLAAISYRAAAEDLEHSEQEEIRLRGELAGLVGIEAGDFDVSELPQA